ncbi:MAG: GNAT family N-acetyltransferase [Thermoflexibacter sp.]|jgi:GNAT superfamily N-acetyltransferase|nr:GNAT family N-acetyltransferase [Thermoflexibacter sp.]
MHITYAQVSQDAEIQDILDLQKANLPQFLTKEESLSQGFVTVEHDFSLLKNMNLLAPSIIAKDDDKVIGYCLAMVQSLKQEIPILVPMFEMIEQAHFQGKKLNTTPYLVMGQVCIHKNYRGLGIFQEMYQYMRDCYHSQYDMLITEVALRNTRSINAHRRVGFQTAYEYTAPNGEQWALIVWKW